MTEKCPAHEELIKTLATIKNDVEWIKKDREEQKARYEKRIAFRRKIHYTVGVSLASAFWYTFENRDNVRLFLKEWLNR